MEGSVLTGRYRLDRLAGRGGMGQVWQARDLALGRDVAVKIMTMPADDGEAGERFLREARATARLSHPGIVSVFDVGRAADGRYFLVMELVRGESLAALLRRVGPLPAATVADVGAQTAAALAVAHAAGVVHRDVKPANLLMTADGTVKVVDFGIALLADESGDPLTRTGTLIGTASYTAPERAQGHGAAPATDLYALGCVLYQALAGRPPFEAGNAAQLLFQHCYQEPEPIEALRPDVPAALASGVRRLMAKDPARRPADATAASTLLTGADLAEPGEAGPARAVAGGTGPARAGAGGTGPARAGAGGTGPARAGAGGTGPARAGAGGTGPARAGAGETGTEHAGAGARGGTRLMPTVSMPESARSRPGRRWRLAGAVVAAVAATVGAFLVGMAVNGDSAASGQGGPSPSASASTAATRTTATPAARQASTETPSDLLAALTARLTGPGAPSGRPVAEDLRRQLSEIGDRLAAGKLAEAGDKLRDLRRRLEDAQRKGDWSGDPVAERLLDRLAAVLPAGPAGPGGPGGPPRR